MQAFEVVLFLSFAPFAESLPGGSIPGFRSQTATSSRWSQVEVDESTTSVPATPSHLRNVQLQKQYVPVEKNGQVVAYKTSYFGRISIGMAGEEKEFTTVFDTGSGHLILPSSYCKSETCLKHRRYNRSESSSAVDIEHDGTVIAPDVAERDQVAISFGTGQIHGDFVEEIVSLGGSPFKMRVVLANDMTHDPFGLFAFDGVCGLGLEPLTLNPAFSMFGMMAKQDPEMKPQFSVFMARYDGGNSVISFGGHDPSRASSEMLWAPVAMPELGYWQVKIKSIRVGNSIVQECADGDCRAIMDTGTSLLGVPRQALRPMHRMLARPVPSGDSQDVDAIDCRAIPGHTIHFELQGGPTLSLQVEDYSRPTPFNMSMPPAAAEKWKLFCRSLLLPVDIPEPLGPKVFIFGEPVLRRYYTVYDFAQRQIGFSLARTPENDAQGLPPVGAPPPDSQLSGAPLRKPVVSA